MTKSSKPTNSIIPKEDLETIERWCERVVSESDRKELRIECQVGGNRVTIVEHSPPIFPAGSDDEWVAVPIAQLCYEPLDSRTRRWILYWHGERWYIYDAVCFTVTPEPLLAEIDRDPDGVFFV